MKAPSETYKALAAPFTTHHKRPDGLTYLSGEQIISRLNEVLDVGGWSFKVLEHGIHVEADEFWAMGELTAKLDGALVIRQQFGSQKTKRSRKDNTPLDIGFDLKGATTDALKKCASLIGVGLYLSSKEEHAPDVVTQDGPRKAAERPAAPTPIAPMQQGVQNAPEPTGQGCPRHAMKRMKPSIIHEGMLVCSTRLPDSSWCNWEMPQPAASAATSAPVVDEAEFDAVFDWGRPS